MDGFYIILRQLLQFGMILMAGTALAYLGVLKKEILPGLSALVSKFLLPAYIFINTVEGNTWEDMLSNISVLWYAAGIYILIIFLFFFLTRILRIKDEKGQIFQLLFVCGNVGFIGIPILLEVYPDSAPVYIAWISLVDQLCLWTYGIRLATGGQKADWRKFCNPALAALLCAVLLLILDIQLPDVAVLTVHSVGNTAGPICMLYLGALLFYTRPLAILKKKELYIGIIVKMLLLPLAAGKVMTFFSVPEDIKTVFVLIAALPTMTAVPMLVPENNKEKEFAAGGTLITVIISIVTIPFVIYLI